MAAAAVSTEAGQTGGKRPEPPSLERLAAAFPQLEVMEFIGQGGMGAVYKARQKQLDRIIALKVLPPGIGGDPSFAERFTREAKALAKLMHPNIVTLFEFGQADGIYYLLMEFVDGVSLGQLLRASRVLPREALAIVPQICDALQYAHDQGIVHRDIKPENILMDRRGRVKVADFGLAKLVAANALLTPSLSPSDSQWQMADGKGQSAPLTGAGKIMGTPNYMAPEQVEHPGEVDHRADIYALGVVFYQMLTGELPGKRMEPPSKKVQIDVRLDEVVMRALEKDPGRRYSQASVLKTQVETIATDLRSATAPPTGTAAPAGAGDATALCATKKKKGEFIGIGCAIQALGIACFFIHPAGWILGIVLLLLGGHMALKVLCSHCGNPTSREARICTTCGAHFLPKGATAPSSGQVEEQRSKSAWIGTLPKLNGPFVVMRGNRRGLNWPVIGYVVGMVLAMFCVVLRIMDHGSRVNLILLFGLFALDYIVRGWRQTLSSLEAQSAKPDVAPAPARGRDYRTRQTLFGLPLVHVTWGIDPATGRQRVAKGIVAVGPVAIGVIAVGFSAWGLFPCGLVAGGFAPVGILLAVGFWAVGLAAAGFQAVGLLALAFWHAIGLVAAGPSPIGLERIIVEKGMVGLLLVSATMAVCLLGRLISSIGSAAVLPGTTVVRPRQDWWTWSPLQSQEVGEICSHLTKAERNHFSVLGLVSSAWVVGTCFGIPAFIRSDLGSGKWIVASVWVILLAVSIPMLQRMVRHFLCSTTWARERGFAPGQLRLFSFGRGNLLKVCAVLAVGLGLVLAQHQAITSYLGLGSSPQPNQKQHQHPKSAAPTERNPSFGPVTETWIADPGAGMPFVFSFETGKCFEPPKDIGEALSRDGSSFDVTALQWLRENHGDAILAPDDVLRFFDGLVYYPTIDGHQASWEELTPNRVIKLVDGVEDAEERKDLVKFITSFRATLRPPAAMVFTTRGGSIGVLQILGSRDNPRRMDFRYKLVLGRRDDGK
jgi:predicted Ser/Thr protein kinase